MTKLRKKATVARRVCRQHTGAFKAHVALAALRDDKTMARLCYEFDLHANQTNTYINSAMCSKVITRSARG